MTPDATVCACLGADVFLVIVKGNPTLECQYCNRLFLFAGLSFSEPCEAARAAMEEGA